jgi:Mg2+ and Co2+ transporter CorA
MLDDLRDVVHIVGIPGIIAAIIWMIRRNDQSQRQLRDIDNNAKLSVTTVAEVKACVDTMQNNHMAHMQGDLNKQTEILTSIDKNIGILVDRNPRL